MLYNDIYKYSSENKCNESDKGIIKINEGCNYNCECESNCCALKDVTNNPKNTDFKGNCYYLACADENIFDYFWF